MQEHNFYTSLCYSYVFHLSHTFLLRWGSFSNSLFNQDVFFLWLFLFLMKGVGQFYALKLKIFQYSWAPLPSKGHRKVGGWCSTVLFFPANTGLAGGGAAACMCHLSELLISRWSHFWQRGGFLAKRHEKRACPARAGFAVSLYTTSLISWGWEM